MPIDPKMLSMGPVPPPMGGEAELAEGGPEDTREMGLDAAAASVVEAVKSGDAQGVKAALLDFIDMARAEE